MSLKTHTLRGIARAGRLIGGLVDRPCPLDACRRVLVFQAGGLGDILRAFPLLLSLGEHLPGAELTTLTPMAETVFDLFPRRDRLARTLLYDPIVVHRGPRRKWRLARELRAHGYDLIVNPGRGEGMLENTLLAYAIGAPHRVGFERDGAGFLHTVKVPLRDDRPIVEQNLDLLRALGIVPAIRAPSVRIPADALAFAAALRERQVHAGERLIGVHPGSRWRRRLQWPAERYAEAARAILTRHRCRFLLLGNADEAGVNEQIAAAVGGGYATNLAGQTTLPQAAAVLSRCDLFIGNDSGLLHLALALKTPSIGIFGETAPEQVIAPEGPCVALCNDPAAIRYRHQPFYRFDDEGAGPIAWVEADEVAAAADTLLAAPHPTASR